MAIVTTYICDRCKRTVDKEREGGTAVFCWGAKHSPFYTADACRKCREELEAMIAKEFECTS